MIRIIGVAVGAILIDIAVWGVLYAMLMGETDRPALYALYVVLGMDASCALSAAGFWLIATALDG